MIKYGTIKADLKGSYSLLVSYIFDTVQTLKKERNVLGSKRYS